MRAFRPTLASLLSVSMILCGCQSSTNPPAAPLIAALPSLALTAAVGPVDSFVNGNALATSASGPVLPLFRIPNIQTSQGVLNLEFWGSKDASGNITSVAEADITGILSSTSSVHVFFDTSSRPVLFRDDASGNALAISYDSATQQTFTLCDASHTAVATVPLTIANGTPQAGTVTEGGSCTPASTVLTAPHSIRASTATNVGNLASLEQLITAGSYLAGFGFALGAIMKFKQHKDNPTVVPIGTPIVLIFVAAALLFIPAIFQSAGGTIFGLENTIGGVTGLVPFFEPLSP